MGDPCFVRGAERDGCLNADIERGE